MKRLILVLCFAVLAGIAFAAPRAETGAVYIPLVSKGFVHQFWQAVKQGAENAGRDLKVTVNYIGPESDAQLDKQIEMLQTELGKNPKAIGFAAIDSKAAIPLLQQAARNKIPVIAFDSGVDSDIPLTTVSTNNIAAAALAADKMAEAIGGSGKVAILVHDQTSRTGIERRDGFVDQVKAKYPNIQIVDIQYSGGDHLRSTEIAKTVINGYPDLKGYYGVMEGTAVGIINAVNELKIAGKIVVIGFDSGKLQLDAIRSGLMYGAVQQDPVGMGYKTVEAAIKAINGQTLPKQIDSGFLWADKSNLDSAAVKAVIYE